MFPLLILAIYILDTYHDMSLGVQSRVYNKERKRVSNALYGPCNMCLESHAPGTNIESIHSIQLWVWHLMRVK